MDNEILLEEILIQLNIANQLLATILVEHHVPIGNGMYAHDEMSLKEWDIAQKLKQAREIINT